MNIKLAFESDIHRVAAKPKSFEELRNAARKTFKDGIGEYFSIFYAEDDQNQSLRKIKEIANQDDFEKCVAYYINSKRRIIKFEINKKEKPSLIQQKRTAVKKVDEMEVASTAEIAVATKIKRGREISLAGIFNEIVNFSSLWLLSTPCYKCSGDEASCLRCSSQSHARRKSRALRMLLGIFEQKLRFKFPELTKLEISPLLRLCEPLLNAKEIRSERMKSFLKALFPYESQNQLDELEDYFPKRRGPMVRVIQEEELGALNELENSASFSEDFRGESALRRSQSAFSFSKQICSPQACEAPLECIFEVIRRPHSMIVCPGTRVVVPAGLRNKGKSASPSDTVLKCISGVFGNEAVHIGKVAPGHEVEVQLILRTPSIEGTYRSFWSLSCSAFSTLLLNLDKPLLLEMAVGLTVPIKEKFSN